MGDNGVVSGRLDRPSDEPGTKWGTVRYLKDFWVRWGGYLVLFLLLLALSSLDAILTPLEVEANPLLSSPSLFLLFKTFVVPVAGLVLMLSRARIPLIVLDGLYIGVLFWHIIGRLFL